MRYNRAETGLDYGYVLVMLPKSNPPEENNKKFSIKMTSITTNEEKGFSGGSITHPTKCFTICFSKGLHTWMLPSLHHVSYVQIISHNALMSVSTLWRSLIAYFSHIKVLIILSDSDLLGAIICFVYFDMKWYYDKERLNTLKIAWNWNLILTQ